MACETMRMWGLSGLIAAFLDLAIAYLLLCASALAFLGSKFLGFFGLSLPCPCNGLFLTKSNKELCLSRLLIDLPTQTVSNVHVSVKQNFPFNNSMWERSNNNGNRVLDMECDASSSSVSDARISKKMFRKDLFAREEQYDVKGKRVIDHRPRSRLRLRRKGASGHGKYSSVSSSDRSIRGLTIGGEPHSSVDNGFGNHHFEYTDDEKDSTVTRMRQRSMKVVQLFQYPDQDTHMKKNKPSTEELQDNNSPDEIQTFFGDEKNSIRLLEQALEEEQTAHADLCIELEKERSAAASAADEAMAMILHLQEEKASAEMESRQYQRILEEKSAYDAEEMNILKEIIMRREREKLFLEKEVESYRQMGSYENEQSGDENDYFFMLQHLSASNIQKQGNDTTNNKKMDLQEKEMISTESFLNLTLKAPQECKLQENPVLVIGKELDQMEEINPVLEMVENIPSTRNGTDTGDSSHDLSLKKLEKNENIGFSNSGDEINDKDSRVYDVHEVDVKRSSLDTTNGLPPVAPKGKVVLSDLRRKSMTAVDSEMLKIDCEIGRLRERLKIVQQEREKLSFSVDNREKENVQLKLLEEIARHIQEIQSLTEHEKTAWRVSLPLPTSKGLSKKRRCRSISSVLYRSSTG